MNNHERCAGDYSAARLFHERNQKVEPIVSPALRAYSKSQQKGGSAICRVSPFATDLRPPLSPSAGVFHPRNAPESQRRVASHGVFEQALTSGPLAMTLELSSLREGGTLPSATKQSSNTYVYRKYAGKMLIRLNSYKNL
jgi:hypothetical protein